MKTGEFRWQGRLLAGAMTLAAAVAAAPVAAQGAAAGLAQAVEQAWRRHPQAAGLDARSAEAAAARDLAAGLTPEPAALSIANLNDGQGRRLGRQEWEAEVAVPLWLPGQREARGAEAAGLAREAAVRAAALRLDVAGQVREAWWALAAARAAATLVARRVETARALDADVRRRFAAGELARIDTNLTQGEVLAAEGERIEAESVLLQAEQAYRLLTGLPAPEQLGEEAPASSPSGFPDEAHPRLAAAAAAAGTARARVRVADAMRRAAPELALRVVRERGDAAEPYNSNVGVRLTIPFASEPRVRRERSAAAAEAAQADAEMRRVQAQVAADSERARRELDAAERQLAMARERRSLAEDTRRLAEKAFALGEADLATLLRIRAAARDAASLHERQRLARAAAISRLNQTLGVLP